MSAIAKLLPLQPGDHLSVADFERRYQAMPDVKKAELIEGVVYMPSPVTDDDHGVPHFRMITWLGVYSVFTTGTQGGDNSTVRLSLGANMPQPDAYLRLMEACGGQSKVGPDGYLAGAPELVGEIAASSASYDLHEKLRAYERNSVREYVVWRTLERAIDWFILRGGKFKRLAADKDGVLRSRVFPGLWLNAAALIEGDMMNVLQTVHAGIASDQHQKFVAKLRSASKVHAPR